MRVVLDTNVLVSGLLNPHGAPGRIVDLVLAGQVTPLYDDRILAEYGEVLARPEFGFDVGDVRVLLDYLRGSCEFVIAEPLAVALPDADDLVFLEVAVAGTADALVTGNRRHFTPLRGSHAVPIESPDRFLRRWTG